MTQVAEPLHTDTLFAQYADFQESLNSGRVAFSEIEEEDFVINEEWIIKNVTEELDAKEFYRFREHCKLTRSPQMSYLSAIGFAIGYIETALAPDSDFWTGVQEGKQAFDEGFYLPEDDKVWAERDIIEHMTQETDVRAYKRYVRFELARGNTPLPYLHLFGFSVGYVDQALTRSV
jgi:hypothetical protein